MNRNTARIFVRDLAAARRFYAETLGLALRWGGVDVGYLVFDAGACQLVVEPVAADADADDQALVGRFTGLSFAVEDIDVCYHALLRAGVKFAEAPARQSWGGITATLEDPDGNAMQMAQLTSSS